MRTEIVTCTRLPACAEAKHRKSPCPTWHGTYPHAAHAWSHFANHDDSLDRALGMAMSDNWLVAMPTCSQPAKQRTCSRGSSNARLLGRPPSYRQTPGRSRAGQRGATARKPNASSFTASASHQVTQGGAASTPSPASHHPALESMCAHQVNPTAVAASIAHDLSPLHRDA